MSGKLIIVPTPIGNLGDMTPRALEALQAADVVCAEDTRVTRKLLNAFDIDGKQLERLDENVLADKASALLERVQNGEVVAYATDAGMPGVSDPGLRLVALARSVEPAVEVEVLPGPTALATAYVASGTTSPTFYFGGFFPRKDKARADVLNTLASLDAALIFYESPNRLLPALEAIAARFPRRELAVCRELTKLHEEVVRGLAGDVLEEFRRRDSIKGEIVVVIDAPGETEREAGSQETARSAAEIARQLLAEGERPKSVAKQLAQDFNLPRNDAYELVLSVRDDAVAGAGAGGGAGGE